jgi:hypothetical protein
MTIGYAGYISDRIPKVDKRYALWTTSLHKVFLAPERGERTRYIWARFTYSPGELACHYDALWATVDL